jgi:hypothetical protein
MHELDGSQASEHRDALRADCARCAGLCCIALGFERSESFSFDKATDVSCPQLLIDNRCAVHGSRARRGLSGCVSYDCYGAGQRVTQELFAGLSWREHPALASSMFETFRVLRRVHELLLLLREAGQLALSPARAERREQLMTRLKPDAGWTPAALLALDVERCQNDVHVFLRSLRDCVTRAPRRRSLPLLP